MGATLWEPDNVTSYSSVWMAGLRYTETVTPTEGDVLVVQLITDSLENPLNNSEALLSSGSARTASDYATFSDGAITISQTGVYEITYNTSVTPSSNAFENSDTYISVASTITSGGYEALPSYPVVHAVDTSSLGAGGYMTRVNFTDQIILVVDTAPVTFYPSINAYNYSASDTYYANMTVVVRRSGDIAA